MLRWLEAANTVWETEHGLTVHLAIGVHTGEAVVGNFGSQTRMEYTCVGDTVNVAARLEHLARPQQILASAQVRSAAPTAADYFDLGKTAVPGRQQPIEVVEID
jgi:class 3 adenylate cyclase